MGEHFSLKKAKEVFQRGIQCLRLSVNLWTNFCVYIAEKSQDLTEIRE